MASPQTLEFRGQISNFLKLSSDVVRNRSDVEFGARGGQILYCFDSTVFQLFYNTVAWRHAVSSFHASSWRSKGPASERWRRIEAQSALIASEHLISQTLPGAKNADIYLTPWHRVELAVRLAAVAREKAGPNIDRARVAEEIKRKLEFLALSRDLKAGKAFPPDPTLKRDMEKLGEFYEDESMVRYELTRRAAEMLVQCETSESLDQIHRLLSRPLRSRIKSLSELFEPDEAETRQIAEDAAEWYLRIHAELEERGSGRSGDRQPGAIWSDAKSLAFVRWASTQRRDDQRLVMVTSDDLLFEVYRNWWVDIGGSAGVGSFREPESFLLRRSFQYTPIFNLSSRERKTEDSDLKHDDAEEDLHGDSSMQDNVQTLFEKISEAIHLTLLPFNLAKVDSRNRPVQDLAHQTNLDYMAMRIEPRRSEHDIVIDYFLGRLGFDWAPHGNMVQDISELWRDVERVGVGFFYEQVVRRLEDDAALFGMEVDVTGSPADVDRALRYLEGSLEVIADRTRSAYLPIAESFLQKQLRLQEGVNPRTPELLWYCLPNGKSVYEIIRTWSGSDNGAASELGDMSGSAEAPFMLAATFALVRQDWWKAEEFAGYALTACKAGRSEVVNLIEVLFVNAFARRYRLANAAIISQLDGSDGRRLATQAASAGETNLYDSTINLLRRYMAVVDYNRRKFSGRDRNDMTLCLIRGFSERAALRLFMALRRYLGGQIEDAIEDADASPMNPIKLAEAAQSDLLECMRLDRKLRTENLGGRHTALRNHFLHNAAASEVVRFVIQGESFESNSAFAQVANVFGTASYKDREQHHPLMRCERIAFQILHQCAEPLELPVLENVLALAQSCPLPLDRRLAEAIVHRKHELYRRLSY